MLYKKLIGLFLPRSFYLNNEQSKLQSDNLLVYLELCVRKLLMTNKKSKSKLPIFLFFI